jgi:DnaJ-class molecular chaperone
MTKPPPRSPATCPGCNGSGQVEELVRFTGVGNSGAIGNDAEFDYEDVVTKECPACHGTGVIEATEP